MNWQLCLEAVGAFSQPATVNSLSTYFPGLNFSKADKLESEVIDYIKSINGLARRLKSNANFRSLIETRLQAIFESDLDHSMSLLNLFADIELSLNYSKDVQDKSFGQAILKSLFEESQANTVSPNPIPTVSEISSSEIYNVRLEHPFGTKFDIKIQFSQRAIKDLAKENTQEINDFFSALRTGFNGSTGWQLLRNAQASTGKLYRIKMSGVSSFRWIIRLEENGVFTVLEKLHKDKMDHIVR